jgi:hypothetical protein
MLPPIRWIVAPLVVRLLVVTHPKIINTLQSQAIQDMSINLSKICQTTYAKVIMQEYVIDWLID